jgi:hypothetical protein
LGGQVLFSEKREERTHHTFTEGIDMKNNLKQILLQLGEEYRDLVSSNARHYMEVDLGDRARRLGLSDITDRYRGAQAIIPLKKPVRGMKVRIDGRTFVNYGQFDSGIAVPGYVAEASGMPYEAFRPQDSMILNFS